MVARGPGAVTQRGLWMREHIEARGNLLLLATDHAHRVQIMKAMTEIEIELVNGMQRSRSMK